MTYLPVAVDALRAMELPNRRFATWQVVDSKILFFTFDR